MIACSNLAKAFGPQTLFAGASIQFNPGNRYGVVGANGSGKSTFLKILAGAELPSDGTLSIPKRIRLGVLGQDHFEYEENRIIDVTMMGHQEVWEAMTEKETILEAAEFDGDRYAELEEVILAHDGYSLEAKAAEVLEGLGIETRFHELPLSTLSGGFKLRVLLGQVLAATPDVLLLDEPTNHLDILSIRWLEKFLAGYPGTTLLISHDHRFLDNVCNYIVDVDYETLTLYKANYSGFVEAKEEQRTRMLQEKARQEKKIAEKQAFVDRFRAKATKARQAQSRVKQIERLEDQIEYVAPTSRRYPTFKFHQQRPSGKEVVKVKGISKAYGEKKVLEDVSLTVRRGEKIAIIGPNGIGKSTLLKILMSVVETDAGEVEWGYETHPGYFAQDHHEILDQSSATVESWLWEACPLEPIGYVRGQLGMVLFSGDDAHKKVASLSGGEAARLVFARLAVEKPNVLILDEPTNHLDLEAIEALVGALKNYDGTLLFVSHDRWFVSLLAERILEISPEGITDFAGSYDEYLERCGDDHLDADAVVLRAKKEKKQKAGSKGAGSGGGGKRSAQSDRAQIKKLEKTRDTATEAIDRAETRVNEINELFCDPTFFDRAAPKEVSNLEQEQKRLAAQIEEQMAVWETAEQDLSELAGPAGS